MQAHLIEVTPTLTNNAISWSLCHTQPNGTSPNCGGPPNYVEVDLPTGNADQLFVVSIKDPSNLGVKFPATVQEALWIQADDKPTGPVMEPKSQILQPTRVNDTILVFIDKNNGSKKLLKYQLNFVGRDNSAVTAIDPDIKNGGGKTGQIGSAQAVAAFVIGAALALALTVLWFKKLSPKRRPS